MIFNIEKEGVGVGVMSNGTAALPLLEVDYPTYIYGNVNMASSSFSFNTPSAIKNNFLTYTADAYAANTLYNGTTGNLYFRKISDHVYMEGELNVSAQAPGTAGYPLAYIPAPCRPAYDIYWLAPTLTVGTVARLYLRADEGHVYCKGIFKLNSNTALTSGTYTVSMTYNYWVPHTNANLNSEAAKTMEIYTIFNSGIAGGVSWKRNAFSTTSPYYGYTSGGLGYNDISATTLDFTIGSSSSSYTNGSNMTSYAAVAIPSDAKHMVVTVSGVTYAGKTINLVAGLLPKAATNPYTEMLTSNSKTYSASTSTASTLSVDITNYAGTSQVIVLHMYAGCSSSAISQLRISKIEFTTT